MENLKIMIIILFLCIYVFFLVLRKINKYTINKNILYYRDYSTIGEGFGMFAIKNIKKGTLIESCYYIEYNRDKGCKSKELDNYSWGYNNKTILPFGYCAILNHSYSPNAYTSFNSTFLNIYALKDINKDEEIFISYGKDYWDTRNIIPI